MLFDSAIDIDTLSSFGDIDTLAADLEGRLGGHWVWFGKYGSELLDLFKGLDIGDGESQEQQEAKRRLVMNIAGTAPSTFAAE
ncbi:hypothetical protein CVT26_013089 [Gymnopilus dilepis]|uniref:Uncharacterized protein n=1 Tax=Gymnopilus dilepis TaxID=231916 RepID=A0A409Y4I8_9AGAR|nr:hypothetical protein CVT26_013089 [Gymnopilus dilepis]